MNRISSLTLLLTLLAAGCHSTKYDNRFFAYDPQQSRTRAILDAQYAAGAATDAALGQHHFEGTVLNGLGRDKLDRMMAAGTRVSVHLDLPPGGESQARMETVKNYLLASGVPIDEQTLVFGPSPAMAGAHGSMAAIERSQGVQQAVSSTEETAPIATTPTQGMLGGR